MYSFIIFFITLAQLLTMLVARLIEAQNLFSILTVYGSPIHLIMNLLNTDSAFVDNNPIYLMFAAYHVLKYVIFFRARLSEGSNLRLTAAVVFEAAYLCISGYYIL